MRSQVVGLAAAALSPGSFSETTSRDGLETLRELLDGPVSHPEAPDLFCFGLLKRFDIDRLAVLATSE